MSRRVHLYPQPGASVPGVPHRELLVEPDVADYVTAHQPPAFTRSKPDGFDPLVYADAEQAGPLEWQPPGAEAPEPTPEPVEQTGSSDSEEPV
jgi:hypothetical protein